MKKVFTASLLCLGLLATQGFAGKDGLPVVAMDHIPITAEA